MKWYAGVEAGGTKFNCIVASDPQHILAETRIPTTTPQDTLPKVISFFRQIQKEQKIEVTSLGLGIFGPICLNKSQSNYGSITTTPKLAWRNTPITSYFENEMHLPIAFDTDVTAAAMGEGLWGAAQDCRDFLYLTIGTGIGGGVISDGRPLHGAIHPEIGHILIPHDKEEDPFPGYCPSHKDCLEGLASGPAIKARWGQAAETLPAEHIAWDLESNYLAFAMANISLSFSPERIILGGGVMKIPGLIDKVRSKTINFLNGYIQSETILNHIENYIQLPGLGDKAGVMGAIALAKTAE